MLKSTDLEIGDEVKIINNCVMPKFGRQMIGQIVIVEEIDDTCIYIQDGEAWYYPEIEKV